MLFLLKQRHRELAIKIGISRGVIQGNVVLKDCGDRRLFKNRLPGTFGFAGSTIDTFVGMDIELVGKLLTIGTDVFVDAIDGTYTNASGIKAIEAKAGNSPRHVLRNLQKARHQATFAACHERCPNPESRCRR